MATKRSTKSWPEMDYEKWSATCDTLHMVTQIVGKVRMKLSHPENHWWHVALYVTPLGLTTGVIPYRDRSFQIDLDLHSHRAVIVLSTSDREEISLTSQTVASFYREFAAALNRLNIEIQIDTLPKEVPNPIDFKSDIVHASYDPDAVEQFHSILLLLDDLLREFRSGFCGKSSPVHFFWGSFDLNLTRFSGKLFPPNELGGCAISEEYSVGFWPGSARYPKPAFYAYAVPAPSGYYDSIIAPDTAHFDASLGEFVLDYADVYRLDDPAAAVRQFLQTTYLAAAKLGHWDRTKLERLLLEPVPA